MQLHCTYGNTVRPDCRQSLTCDGHRYVVDAPACAAPPAGLCAATPPQSGDACGSDAAVCDYADGTICNCTRCAGGPCGLDDRWLCAPPPTDSACPPIAPNDGSACAAAVPLTSDGATCTYGDACATSGATAMCTDGVWVWQSVVCPLAP